MNCGAGYNNCFRIRFQIDVRILGNLQIFDFDHITDLHLTDIHLNFIHQVSRQCLIRNLFQIFLQNTCLYFLMVEQNDLCYGMYFLGTYQCLEINLIHAVCHCIVINLFDQCIVGLAVYFQHNLTSFVVRLQQLIYCLFRHLDRKRSFNLSAKQITCDIAFSS